jgi:integrase
VRQEIISTNPCHGIERPTLRSRERVLSDTELPLLWAALDGMGTAEAQACQAILLTGQRPGEVIRMRAEHVKDGVWCMPGAPVPAVGWPGTKNSRSHNVPLPPLVLDAVNGSGYVFGNSAMRLSTTMRQACVSAGITDPVQARDLRRTFGTWVTRLGFGRAAMDRLLNHADHSISSVYDRHSYADEDRAVVQKISEHVMMLVDGAG